MAGGRELTATAIRTAAAAFSEPILEPEFVVSHVRRREDPRYIGDNRNNGTAVFPLDSSVRTRGTKNLWFLW
jgi:hypothetical protein